MPRNSVADLIPKFQYRLVKLRDTSSDRISTNQLALLGLEAMRFVVREEQAKWLQAYLDDAVELATALKGVEQWEFAFRCLLSYISATNRHHSQENLRELIEKKPEKIRTMALDIFEEEREIGREEGRREGREEGRKKGRKEGRVELAITFARNMAKEGFSPEKIAELTELPLNKVQAIIDSEQSED